MTREKPPEIAAAEAESEVALSSKRAADEDEQRRRAATPVERERVKLHLAGSPLNGAIGVVLVPPDALAAPLGMTVQVRLKHVPEGCTTHRVGQVVWVSLHDLQLL